MQTTTISDSIFHLEENKEYQTELIAVNAADLKGKTEGWNFDWVKEAAKYEVYKLVAIEQPKLIQGLISVEE